MSETFGGQVRAKRAELGISQARLGELTGASASTVRRWERDEALPTGTRLKAVEAVLGISLEAPESAAKSQEPDGPTGGSPSLAAPPSPPSPPPSSVETGFFSEEPDLALEAETTVGVSAEPNGDGPAEAVAESEAVAEAELEAEAEAEVAAGAEAVEAEAAAGADESPVDPSAEILRPEPPKQTPVAPDPFPGPAVTMATPWIPSSTGEAPRSFVDSPHEMLTYRIRWALTVGAFLAILLVVLWSYDQVGPALDAVLEPLRVFSSE